MLRRADVPVLPPGSPDVTLLHLSDLHLTPSRRDRVAWVKDLATVEADAVVNTGDNLAHADAVPVAVEALAPLLDRPGAFVFGSNDYFAPRPANPLQYFGGPSRHRATRRELPHEQLRAVLSASGWVDLTNTRGTMTARGVTFDLVGTDDAHLGRDEFPADAPVTGGAAVRMGVTHAPYLRVLERMRADGATLVLAGHTHGGQVCVPGYGALVTNCDLDTRRVKGLTGWPGRRPDEGGDSMWLHVSAGLGTSPYAPFRFACRPEATLLTLTAAQ